MHQNIESLKDEARNNLDRIAAEERAAEEAARVKDQRQWESLLAQFRSDWPALADHVEADMPDEMMNGGAWDGEAHYCHQIRVHAFVPGHRPVSIRYTREHNTAWGASDHGVPRSWETSGAFFPDADHPENPQREDNLAAATLGEILLLAEASQLSYEAAVVEGRALAARRSEKAGEKQKPLPTNDKFGLALRDWLIEDGFVRDEGEIPF